MAINKDEETLLKLKKLKGSLQVQQQKLDLTLDKLALGTAGGSLHDLKMAIDPKSDLGRTIDLLQSKVVMTKTKAAKEMETLIATIDSFILKKEKVDDQALKEIEDAVKKVQLAKAITKNQEN